MTYKLVVDSCCEISPDMVEGLEVQSVPLSMSLGDKVFVDDEKLDVNEFITEMNNYSGCPKSACPSPEAYREAFSGADMVFGVTISSNLSGSFASAKLGMEIAAENGQKGYVFDSKSASAGEILISLKIYELIQKGLKPQKIIETVENFIKNMRTFFALENLDNLVKNGRMNKIIGKLVTVMHIRPILGADEQGNIAFYSKARGGAQVLEKLAEMIEKYGGNLSDKILAITHCNNEKAAKDFYELVKKRFNFKGVCIRRTRGLSSMYANNGGLIIAF